MKKLLTFLTAMFIFITLNAQTFSEGFENGLPFNWTTIDADGDEMNWMELMNNQIYTPHSGIGHMISHSYAQGADALTPDNWLITPKINLKGITNISFWVTVGDPVFSAEHYGVYISKTGTAIGDFTKLLEETLPTPVTSRIWYNKEITLPAYSGDVYIAFRHFNVTSQSSINLDDVSVTTAVGVSESELTTVNIYPNPTSEFLFVAAEGYNTVAISNMIGQVISTENISEPQFQLDVANLTSGVYFITLQGERGTTSKKFIKK